MKKFLTLLLSLSFIFSFSNLCFSETVSDVERQVSYTYFEDGSYFVSVISDENNSQQTRSSTTVTKSKTSTYYSSNDTALWYVKVTGEFTYGNGTAICNSTNVSAGSYVSVWTVSNKSASKTGSSATAKATGKLYQSGMLVTTINKTVTLTCDSKGNFS